MQLIILKKENLNEVTGGAYQPSTSGIVEGGCIPEPWIFKV